jgi:hypothetical protein
VCHWRERLWKSTRNPFTGIMSHEKSAERAFVERAMVLVKETIYPGVSESVLAREWQDLLIAISEPAAYLHSRGAKLPGSRYLAILRVVITGIVSDGSAQRSRYRPMYLRKCLQEHMRFQGEIYLSEAKGMESRPAGAVAANVIRKLRLTAVDPEAARLTDALVTARDLISAQRKK